DGKRFFPAKLIDLLDIASPQDIGVNPAIFNGFVGFLRMNNSRPGVIQFCVEIVYIAGFMWAKQLNWVRGRISIWSSAVAQAESSQCEQDRPGRVHELPS